MGHVQRDGIDRLRAAKGYSHQYDTICTGTAWPGYIAGTGMLGGVNPEQMAESDCVVIWGTNAVHTQVNVMTHAMRARKERGAKIVVIDIYRTATMDQADLGLIVRPGTDGALAVAVMHVLLRENLADRAYMAKFTDFGPDFEAHLASKTPEWAAEITGLTIAEIETFARLVGTTPRSYLPPRLWLHPPAQWRHRHARGPLHSRDDRRLAASRRRRFPFQFGHLGPR